MTYRLIKFLNSCIGIPLRKIHTHREKKIFTLKVCFSNYKIMMLFVSKLYFLIVNDISL